MNYSQAIQLAEHHYGENWYQRCSIVACYTPMALPGYYHVTYHVSTKQPAKGPIRA